MKDKTCKHKKREAMKRWYKKHPNWRDKYSKEYLANKSYKCKIKKKYNITLEEYNKILKSQSFKCKICGKTVKENRKKLAIDHNHVTGKVRGLLCSICNISIGHLENDLLRIKVEYIMKDGRI